MVILIILLLQLKNLRFQYYLCPRGAREPVEILAQAVVKEISGITYSSCGFECFYPQLQLLKIQNK